MYSFPSYLTFISVPTFNGKREIPLHGNLSRKNRERLCRIGCHDHAAQNDKK